MKDINTILEEIYNTSPYMEWRNETEFDEEIVGKPLYGEITLNGTNMIVEKFKEHFNKDTIFYDLGSGLGKMVLHIGLQYKVKKSIGIEYSKERDNGAQYLKNMYAKECDNIIFIKGNMLDIDISDATVIYIDNTAFNDEMMEKVFNKLQENCLLLYKKHLNFLPEKYTQKLHQRVTERTYGDHTLMWLFKK